MELLELLVNTKPEEKSGSLSSNRFSYQKHWALFKLLDLHSKGKDYLIILDYHDDILILNSESSPTSIDFYQIKTKKGSPWTLTKLINKGKKQNSIIGKLYKNKLNFQNETNKLYLVSNNYFSLDLEDNITSQSLSEIPLNKLKNKSKLHEKLKKELEIDNCNDVFELTHFNVTSLSLEDHKNHLIGSIVSFLQENNLEKIHPNSFYKTVYSVIDKNNDNELDISSTNELISSKGIGKTLVDSVLNRLNPVRALDDEWSTIKNTLLSHDFNLFELKKIEKAWQECELSKMNDNSISFNKLQINVIEQLERHAYKFSNYKDLMVGIYEKVELTNDEYQFDEYLVKALILMEFCLM